jgi:hypothetical protein
MNGLDSFDLIKFKYSRLLNLLNFRTGNELNGISFQKKIRTIPNTGESRTNSLSIFREGDISFNVKDNRLIINWLVRLDSLYFISVLVGIASGILIGQFSKLSLVVLFFVGICIAMVFAGIGIISIRSKIDEINLTILEKINKNAP